MIMRTRSEVVTFRQPFTLNGFDEGQPAGAYVVETDEELLPSVLHSGYRRTDTWLMLPSAESSRPTQLVRIDPADLAAALEQDRREPWTVLAESHIDRMLSGSVMTQAVHSAGLTIGDFKEQLRDLAGRLARARPAKL
jgi:hypothetical protein